MLSRFSPDRLRSQAAEQANKWRTDWYAHFEPRSDRDYSPELEHAKTLYGYLMDLSYKVDAKADSMFKFAATAAGVAIGVVKAFDFDGSALYWLTPSLFFFAMSIISAVLAKRTFDLSLPLASNWLLPLDGDDKFIRANIAATYYVATQTMVSLTTWKAEWVNKSTRCLVIALLLVPACLLAAAVL